MSCLVEMGVTGNFVWYLFIVVILMGFDGAKRSEERL